MFDPLNIDNWFYTPEYSDKLTKFANLKNYINYVKNEMIITYIKQHDCLHIEKYPEFNDLFDNGNLKIVQELFEESNSDDINRLFDRLHEKINENGLNINNEEITAIKIFYIKDFTLIFFSVENEVSDFFLYVERNEEVGELITDSRKTATIYCLIENK